jgi:hypothetical protein
VSTRAPAAHAGLALLVAVVALAIAEPMPARATALATASASQDSARLPFVVRRVPGDKPHQQPTWRE